MYQFHNIEILQVGPSPEPPPISIPECGMADDVAAAAAEIADAVADINIEESMFMLLN